MASYNMLKNTSSEILLPMTRSDCVTMGNGKTFQEELNNLGTTICNLVYPVGTVITTYTNTNPSSIFGGTWAIFGTNRTLISAGDPYLTRQNGVGAPDSITLNDGSKWDLVFFQSTAGGLMNSVTAMHTPFTSGTANYSALKFLPNYFQANGEIEFLMAYNIGGDCLNPTFTPSLTGRWKQNGNPTHTVYHALNGRNAEGYVGTRNIGATSFQEGLYVPWSANGWGGLSLSTNGSCLIDGSPSVDTWCYAIGAYVWHNGGIPDGNATARSDVILYARTDLLELEKCRFPENRLGGNTCTLTNAQNGAHCHRIGSQKKSSGSSLWDTGGGSALAAERTQATGGGEPHNNMQPYVTAYYWERTA